jgi:hypothetical protein
MNLLTKTTYKKLILYRNNEIVLFDNYLQITNNKDFIEY